MLMIIYLQWLFDLPILYILYSYRSALQGMENTLIPMVSGIVELIMRVSVALILPQYIGVYGIYLAECTGLGRGSYYALYLLS